MKTIVLAGVLGGLAAFLWSAISWMALPFHGDELRGIQAPDPVITAFLDALPETGIYHHPPLPPADADEAAMTAFVERMEKGPRIPLMVFRKEGTNPFPPENFVLSILTNVLGALIAAWLLSRTTVRSYGGRVLFVSALGAFGALAMVVPGWIWWSYPASHGLIECTDAVAAWTLAGLVIAKLAPTAEA